jgi:hypothetical protein
MPCRADTPQSLGVLRACLHSRSRDTYLHGDGTPRKEVLTWGGTFVAEPPYYLPDIDQSKVADANSAGGPVDMQSEQDLWLPHFLALILGKDGISIGLHTFRQADEGTIVDMRVDESP